MRRHIISFVTALVVVNSNLFAQPAAGHPISKHPFKSALEYQQAIGAGCKAPQFNVSCGKLLLAWQGALPGMFKRVVDVEEFLLTQVTQSRCGSGRLDVAGVTPAGDIRFRVRELDADRQCLWYKGKVVALLDCGNPARPLPQQRPPVVRSVVATPPRADTAKAPPPPIVLPPRVDTVPLLVHVRDTVPKIVEVIREVEKPQPKKKQSFLTWKRVGIGVGIASVAGTVICISRKDKCGFGSMTQTTTVGVTVNQLVIPNRGTQIRFQFQM